MGRIAWSPKAKSCVVETLNVVAGTEMYSIIAIPSKKNLGVSGGVVSMINREREKAFRDALWNALAPENVQIDYLLR